MNRIRNGIIQKALRVLVVPAALLCATIGLQASSFTFGTGTTGSGTSVSCGSGTGTTTCAATAVFNVTSANTFTVTLDNLISPLHSAGQLVTDLMFTLSATTLSLSSSSGNKVDIDTHGNPSVVGTNASTGWSAGHGTLPVGSWLLCTVCGDGVSGGAAPAAGIIPDQGNYTTAGAYSSANSSIKNGSHDPFLESGATFSFTTTGIDLTKLTEPFSGVSISFGTTFGARNTEIPAPQCLTCGGTVTGTPNPEPMTPILAGAGLIAIGLIRRRRPSGNKR